MHTTMNKKEDLKEWEKYWEWTVLWWYEAKPKPNYLCQCSCWKVKRVQKSHLTSWRSTKCWSCAMKKKSTIHGFTTHDKQDRFYAIYHHMKNRCNCNKATRYHRYWWRWIKCEWNSFEEYKDDMYESYLKHVRLYWELNTTIDRIDNNWNYCKNNCRRATIKEQSNNTSRTRYFNYEWKLLTASQIADKLWTTYYRVYYRLWRHWWTIEELKKDIQKDINKVL